MFAPAIKAISMEEKKSGNGRCSEGVRDVVKGTG
jgi:hypothetical protein